MKQATTRHPHMQKPDGALLDLGASFVVIRRRLIPIILVICAVLAVTAIAYLLTNKRYTATARVALDRVSTDLVQADPKTAALPTDSPSVDTEVQVIGSPSIAEAVVDRLSLGGVEGFGRAAGISVADARAEGKTPADARARAISVVHDHLDVQREGLSYAISVDFTGSDPVYAAAVANAVVDAYVNGQRTGKYQQRQNQIDQLAQRMQKLRTDVIGAETAVARYRAANNLVAVEQDSTASQSALSSLNAELATARSDAAAASARAGAARSGATTALLGNSVISDLRSRQALLQAERNNLAGRYGPRHPSLSAVDRQLSEIQASIGAETARVRTGLEVEAQAANQRAGSISSSLSRQQGTLVAGNAASVRLAELERTADSARQLYQTFLNQYRQALAAQGSEQSGAYVIARASPPGMPSFPSLPAFVIGGLVAALAAAGALAFVLELRERGFRSRGELETALGIPVLATVPDMRTVKNSPVKKGSPLQMADYLLTDGESLFAESFRAIRTALRLGKDDPYARVLAVTSSLPDEGKTTTAICLARSAAQAGLRTLLIDCDLRRRASSRNLAGKLEGGLVDVLRGDLTLDAAVLRDETSGAYVLPQPVRSPNDNDLVASSAMEKLLIDARDRFDLIILDLAPVLAVAESRALAAMADTTLLVTRWRATPVQAAKAGMRELERNNASIFGSVLTQVDVRVRAGAGSDIYYYEEYKSST